MAIFYLLTIFAALPIIAYILGQKTSNKGIVFGISSLVLIFCVIIFTSKFALIGSFQKQLINTKIFDQINIDSPISEEYLKKIEDILNENEIQNWLIALISKSIDLKKLTSAESLIIFSERFFTSSNEKIIFYELYTLLRDEKFPEFKNSSFLIDKDSILPCEISSGKIDIFVMNGPDIPIAKKDFKNIDDLKLTNTDSVIPGFDLSSAYLNNETLEIYIEIICMKKQLQFYFENLIVLDIKRTSLSYKINLNEWLKQT
tara:strand:+ start:379 stop:1155 length:777 start_codon:yes stop_codon:yes gene_type:complete